MRIISRIVILCADMRIHWLLAAFCAAAALTACSVDAVTFTQGNEDCELAGDEDGNSLADCSDPACAGEPACQPRCGNGRLDLGEDCDDGNQVTEVCPSGTASCTVCDAVCQTVAGQTSLCGDRIVQTGFGEICDDGNAACGTCSANCQTFGSGAATGSISVIKATLVGIGQTFTLHDGIIDNPADGPITFEFATSSGTVSPGHLPVVLLVGQNATTVRNLVRDAINNVELNSPYVLHITATTIGTTGSVVNLTHDLFTNRGNVPMTETVFDVTVNGMSGGLGGDCGAGQACQGGKDCVSTVCQLNVCQ
jgi:hypothetical protein